MNPPKQMCLFSLFKHVFILMPTDIATSDTIRDELTEAIRSKDIDKLEKAIEDAEAAGYPELGAKLHKARDTLDALGGGRGG